MNSSLITRKQWANQFYYMLKNGTPVREVKRKLYDDHEAHRKLKIQEDGLDRIWNALMENTFDPTAETRLGQSRERKEDRTMSKQVIQFNPETKETLATFSSAKECSQKTGLSYGVVNNILYGITDKPKIHIRYAEASEASNTEKSKKIKVEKPKFEPKPKKVTTETEEVKTIESGHSVSKAVLHIESPVSLSIEEARAVYIAALKAEATKRITDLEVYLIKTESELAIR